MEAELCSALRCSSVQVSAVQGRTVQGSAVQGIAVQDSALLDPLSSIVAAGYLVSPVQCTMKYLVSTVLHLLHCSGCYNIRSVPL